MDRQNGNVERPESPEWVVLKVARSHRIALDPLDEQRQQFVRAAGGALCLELSLGGGAPPGCHLPVARGGIEMSESNAPTPPDRTTQEVVASLLPVIEGQIALKLQERDERRRNERLVTFSIIATIVAAAVVYMLNTSAEITVLKSGKLISDEIEEQRGEIELNYELLSLERSVMRFDASKTINANEAGVVIRDIESLNSKLKDAEGRDGQFRIVVETAARNFALAYLVDYVDRMEAIHPNLAQVDDVNTLQSILHMRGRQLLAEPGLASWANPADPMADVYKRYRAYAEGVRKGGYPEVYLAYELLLTHLEEKANRDPEASSQTDDKMARLFEEGKYLNEVDAENFVVVMADLAGDPLPNDSVRSKRIASRVKDFICEYRDQNTLLSSVYDSVEFQCPMTH